MDVRAEGAQKSRPREHAYCGIWLLGQVWHLKRLRSKVEQDESEGGEGENLVCLGHEHDALAECPFFSVPSTLRCKAGKAPENLFSAHKTLRQQVGHPVACSLHPDAAREVPAGDVDTTFAMAATNTEKYADAAFIKEPIPTNMADTSDYSHWVKYDTVLNPLVDHPAGAITGE